MSVNCTQGCYRIVQYSIGPNTISQLVDNNVVVKRLLYMEKPISKYFKYMIND